MRLLQNLLQMLFAFFLIVGIVSSSAYARQVEFDSGFALGLGANSTILAIQPLSSGRMLVGGVFSSFDGQSSNYLIQLTSTGSVDTSFSIGGGFNNLVRALALQPDGKIVVGGDFISFNSNGSNYITRLNSNGSLDLSFASGVGFNQRVNVITLLSGGQMLVGGRFTEYNGFSRNYIAKLFPDGSLDTSFTPGALFNAGINAIVVQPDGKIVVGGNVVGGGGHVTRLNSDGTIDTTFSAAVTNAGVRSFALQPDGKIIVGGDFTVVNGSAYGRIVRLYSNGTIDTTFDVGSGFGFNVYTLIVDDIGGVVAGTHATTFNGSQIGYLARLNSQGALDSSFYSGSGFNGPITALASISGGLLVGGGFTQYNSLSRGRIVRLIDVVPPVMIGTGPVLFHHVFGGGGNIGSPYYSDFIVLYNSSNQSISLSGWKIENAGATQSFPVSGRTINLTGLIMSQSYYVIEIITNTSNGIPIIDHILPNLTVTLPSSASGLGSNNNKLRLIDNEGVIRDFLSFGSSVDQTLITGVLINSGLAALDINNSTSLIRIAAQGTNRSDFAIQQASSVPGCTGSLVSVCLLYLNEYLVTFIDHDATILATGVVVHGESALAPFDPIRTGYTFVGRSPMSFVQVTGVMQIVAQYDINEYILTFDSNGGTLVQPLTGTYNSVVISPEHPIRTGYAFVGWNPVIPSLIPSFDSFYVATWVDTIPPTATITYSPSTATSGDVIATLTGASEAITITNNGGLATYTFTGNGTFTFEFQDAVGNTGSTTATVNYIDKTAPVMTLSGSQTVRVQLFTPYTEQGATAIDNVNGSLTSSISISGVVNVDKAGVYPITYTVADVVGNRTTVVRMVEVFIPVGGAMTSSSSSSLPSIPPISSSPAIDNSTNNSIPVNSSTPGDTFVANPSIVQDYCYTPRTQVSVIPSMTLTVEPEFEQALGFMYVYELTRFDAVDQFVPYANLTREQAARLFANFATNVLCRTPDATVSITYADQSIADPTLQSSIVLSYQLGLMKGGPDGTFRPKDMITKAEFNAVLVRLLLNRYLDETGARWYQSYNTTATDLGIITRGATSIPLTRHDASLMLYRAYQNQSFIVDDVSDSFVLDE